MKKILATLALWALCNATAWGAALAADEVKALTETRLEFKSNYPSEAAFKLARSIGAEGRVDRLRALIALRNWMIVSAAVDAYPVDASMQLQADVEALIVQHYADTQARQALFRLIGKRTDRGIGRFPKYRSRALFEALYSTLKEPGSNQYLYARYIVLTDLGGLEREIADVLPLTDRTSAVDLVRFLGERKATVAVPALIALQGRSPYGPDGVRSQTELALLQIGTPESVQAVLDSLRALGGQGTDSQATDRIRSILSQVQMLPAGSLPHYPELRAALPQELAPVALRELVKIILNRRDRRGIPDLIQAVDKVPPDAIGALLAMGEPADWRAARAQLDRDAAGLTPSQLANLQKRLDEAIADPTQFVAKRRAGERQESLEIRWRRFAEEHQRLATASQTDPQRFAKEHAAWIERRAAFLREHADLPVHGMRLELARDYATNAAFVRFRLGRPAEAIAVYQARRTLLHAAGEVDMSPIAMADIHRFDPRDPRKAIDHYRVAMVDIGDAARRPGEWQRWPWAGVRSFIEREIAYLERGVVFSGGITRGDFEAVTAWGMLSPMAQTEPDAALREALNRTRAAESRGEALSAEASGLMHALEALAPSQLHIFNVAPAAFHLPPEKMLQFFLRHDPAGYLTAVYFGMATHLRSGPSGQSLVPAGKAETVTSTAREFLRTRGIHVSIAPEG